MKKLICAAFIIVAGCSDLIAGELVVEGNFMGKNIFVKNEYRSSGTGYCITEVTVNGKTSTDEIGQSSFEIDLISLQMPVGTKVTIKIKHEDGCKPKIVNPEDLKPRATFEVVANTMKVTKEGMVAWTTVKENGKLTFIVEQKRWNKWVKVGETEGRGTPDQHSYQVKYDAYSGENRIRIKQVDVTGPKYSDEIKYRSMSPVVTFTQGKDQNVSFSADTKWEVYDLFGNIAKQGNGNEIDVSALKKGTYYVNYDNKTGDKIIKK